MSAPTATARSGGRLPEIDMMKAIAIVSVVVIHSSPALPPASLSPGQRVITFVTQFAVPCFLMCSGFLYATRTPVPRGTTLARLRRLLLPYLPAAVLAGLFRELVLGIPVSWARDLLLGHTFGIYYYVFVIFTLVLVTPLIPLVPAPVRWLASAFLIASGSVRSLAPILEISAATADRFSLGLDPSFPWHLRHPLLVWGYFFAGWELRLVTPGLAAALAARPWLRAAGVVPWAVLTGAVVVWAFRAQTVRLVLVSWPLIYATLGALVVATFGRVRGPAQGMAGAGAHTRAATQVYTWLSRRTYFIYLYHLFFVLAAQRLWPAMGAGPSYLLLWAHVLCGLLGPVAMAIVLERALPAAPLSLFGLPARQKPAREAHETPA